MTRLELAWAEAGLLTRQSSDCPEAQDPEEPLKTHSSYLKLEPPRNNLTVTGPVSILFPLCQITNTEKTSR